MDMRVVQQVLPPGVEDGEEPELGAQMLTQVFAVIYAAAVANRRAGYHAPHGLICVRGYSPTIVTSFFNPPASIANTLLPASSPSRTDATNKPG
jgi:hypothetical protein